MTSETSCVYCISNQNKQKTRSGVCHWTKEPHCEGCCSHICDPDWKALPEGGREVKVVKTRKRSLGPSGK